MDNKPKISLFSVYFITLLINYTVEKIEILENFKNGGLFTFYLLTPRLPLHIEKIRKSESDSKTNNNYSN